MSDVTQLLSRIDSAIETSQRKIRDFQNREVQQHHERQQRLEQFGRLLVELRDVWQPRLQALAERFGQKVQVTPTVTPELRSATFSFASDLARIELRLSAFTDFEVRKAIFCYDLEILPILMKFDQHAEIEFPLDAVNREQLAQWIDDQIVSFVTTYLSLHENAYYLKGHMVQDPVAGVEFPRFAAGATAEWDGKTVYFISDETCREYAARRAGSTAKQ
jgi:YHS domain-containing protein